MFELYLLCLIIGGGLLAFSVFMGGDSDASGGADTDFSADADVHTDIHTDVATDADVHADSHSSADSVKFISLRNIIYFAAFFGLTGTVFTTFFDYSRLLVLALSIVVGAFAAVFGFKLMKYLKGSETGEAVDLNTLVGKQAMVSLPLSKENKGKIYLDVKGSTTELVALAEKDSLTDSFKIREKVCITRIENGIVYVSDNL